MKILHTADWHLGKTFLGENLLQDQKHVLDQLVAYVEAHRPQVLLLAGDVYDRSVPPTEAVRLFDEALSKIILEYKTPVIAIAGNHDSPERLHFGAYLLQKQGLHIRGSLELPLAPVILADDQGEVYFYPLPYTEPETLRYVLSRTYPQEPLPVIETHADVMRWIVNHIQAHHPAGKRAVFVGHAYIAEAQGEDSDSERQLSVGGAALVPAEVFDFFDYTALGHLHKPLSFGGGKVKYSGALLKYSFSEADYEKSVLLIDLPLQNPLQAERLPLRPRRQVRRVEGYIENRTFCLQDAAELPQTEDYLEVRLHNVQVVPNAMPIIKQQYPNALSLRWVKLPELRPQNQLDTAQISQMSPVDLFADFYHHFTGQALDNAKKQVLEEIAKDLQQQS
ncbi:MAG: exonuclease SbcCD subunit D [Microscillaceae bacterium]